MCINIVYQINMFPENCAHCGVSLKSRTLLTNRGIGNVGGGMQLVALCGIGGPNATMAENHWLI